MQKEQPVFADAGRIATCAVKMGWLGDPVDSPTDYCTVRVMGGLMAVVLPEVPVTVTV
jgi:hypothetical protein